MHITDVLARPTILTFVSYYLPGYKSGGPVRTIANMVEHLGDELDFRIVTSDRDSFEDHPYPDIEVNAWNRVGKAKVYYAAQDALALRQITRLIRATPHNVLYLNSFFQPCFTAMPLIARRLGLLPRCPVVLAPRGEFSEGALALKSWKKQAYIGFARSIQLYRDLIWQASSQHEAEDIRRAMGRTARNIQIAPNLPPPVVPTRMVTFPLESDENRPLRLVFLSRISPKKNLDFALEVLQQVSVPVEFNIYGLIDDITHWQKCDLLIGKLPSHVKAKHHGAIKHEEVANTLAAHDLFFLPTRGENYGHAIYEALAAGVPPLISDQTPWRDLDEAGVGWVRPLQGIDSFLEVIELAARFDRATRNSQSQRAKEYASQVAGNHSVLKQNLDLFTTTIKVGGSV